MTETTRRPESTASTASLVSGVRAGQHEVGAGVHEPHGDVAAAAAARSPRGIWRPLERRSSPRRCGVALRADGAGAELLRSGAGWLLAASLAGGAGRAPMWSSIRRASRSIGGPDGPRRIDWTRGKLLQLLRRWDGGRTAGVERGARADAGGRSGAAADAGNRDGTQRPDGGAQSPPSAYWRRKGFGVS